MASFSVSCPKSSAFPQCGSRPENQQQQQQQQQHYKISFPRSRTSFLAGSSLDQSPFLRIQGNSESHSAVRKVQGQLNAVAAEKSSNSAPVTKANLEESPPGGKDGQAEEPALQNAVPDASSISAFMAQVADLIKLVDSKDIMELQLKQLDCELIIRKKEALQQTPTGAPVYMMQPPPPQAMVPSHPPPTQGIAPASAGPAPSAPVQALPAPASKSSHPPLKCPMAGTFYRSPGPGEPSFVKVGDKVQKGQVLCIIEAMKLMNEIEADQSGTLTEILVEDGKPVSLDTPLFIIAP